MSVIPIKKRTSNPRAVSVGLDELTYPGPDSADFYIELGNRIIGLGREAGLSQTDAGKIQAVLRGQSEKQARSIRDGAVREFVKMAANEVARRI